MVTSIPPLYELLKELSSPEEEVFKVIELDAEKIN